MKTVRMLKVLLASLALLCTGTAPAQVVISEFMAANSHGIVDEDGTHSDWLELYNAGTTPVMLDGWYLTDDSGWSTKWRFPEGMAPLQPNSYLLVWASGKDKRIATNPLHTNFKLGRESGYLALLDTTATVVSSFDSYPPQIVDVSYGRDRINLDLVGFFHNPTPNAQNINGAVPPVFSHESGIYTNASISVTITAAGTVYYTSDSSLPNTNSTLYTGPITLATNSTIKARAFPPAGSTDLPSDVVARNYIFLDDSTVDFNSNLPLLIISTEGRPLNEIDTGAPRTNGSLTVIDVKNARSALRSVPDAQVLAGFEYYGQTSIGFPKKPIRVETQDAYGNDLKMSILGLPPAADFKLRNPYDDKTFLNDFLSTELYEQMGHYSVKRRYVEVFLNTGGGRLHYDTDYYGIMVLFESIEIDQERLNLAKISVTATNEPEISGGYIFKKDKDSPGDVNFYTAGGSGFFQQYIRIHEPRAKDLRASLPNGPLTDVGRKQLGYLNNYLNMMERALYANDWLTATGTNHYSYYLDADSFVDLHWMVEFAKYVDGYRVSSFFYKDRGGKVTAGPIWGWNFAFGNCNFLLGGQTNGWYSDELDDSTRIWLHRLIYGSPSGTNGIGDPNFVQKIADRWGVLRTNIFNSSHVMARIDELASYLKGAAQRDFAKYNTLGKYIWPNPDGGVATAGSNGTIDGRDVDYVRPTTYNDGTSNSIIWQMKKYVNGRYLWIDSQFTAPPFIHASSGAVTNGYSVLITAKPGAQIYYRTDGLDPRGSGGSTNGTLYTGPLLVNGNVKIVARAREAGTWKDTWSGPAQVNLFTSVPALRITEIMYHPPDSTNGQYESSDFEYLEVKNIGDSPLNVNHFSLAGGIQFLFPDFTLAAGQSAVVVRNVAAFQSRYGTTLPGILILGEFRGHLSDSSDQLVLKGPLEEPILDFVYSDKWYPSTDGFGFSLVVVNESAPLTSWGTSGQWRPSSTLAGSPGLGNGIPSTLPPILINEVIHRDPPYIDVIELYNPTANSVDIGGWFMTDDLKNPTKYKVPYQTILQPHGYLGFYETLSPPFPSEGDELWLFSGNGTNLTGYAHHVRVGYAPDGQSFGRYVLSTGTESFVLQIISSLSVPNVGPLVGPIVITELNPHPPNIAVNGLPYSNTKDEYIEFQNITGTNVALYDLAHASNAWKLTGQVQFTFPSLHPASIIPPGGFFYVVGFDPEADTPETQAFRQLHGIPGTVPLFGPWSGTLSDMEGQIELVQPDAPKANGLVPYFTSDMVHYSNRAPWPGGWNASGRTLQRISPAGYGNDPGNWATLAPSPASNQVPTGEEPIIISQPKDQVVPTGRDLSLSVVASGSALRYQWQRNGLNISGATNSILVISNYQTQDVGPYNILAYNSAGAVLGTEFHLDARTGLKILQPPTARVTTNAGSTNFTVVAIGSGPIHYQWKLNGVNVTEPNTSGATTEVLTITNVQTNNEGEYTVAVTDDYETITSAPATLKLVYKAFFTVHPLSQAVVEGGSVTLSVAASGTTPMTFRWRKQTDTFTYTNLAIVVGPSNSFFTISNFHASDATNYNVTLSNVLGFASGGPLSGVSRTAVLMFLADSDHDGLPDAWENGRAGFSATDPTDAARDDDGDGMSNLAEFIAGTDYLDPQSYLKVNIGPSGAAISFVAVSNRTYSILYSDGVGYSFTQKLANVLAYPTNSVRTVVDPSPGTNRFYRLTTPGQP